MIRWRRVVQQYGCGRCGAAPGEKCVTDSGRTTYTPHADRTDAASRDHWTTEDVRQENEPCED